MMANSSIETVVYRMGWWAANFGHRRESCPYPIDGIVGAAWLAGFDDYFMPEVTK